ncbi:hypothetical protein DCO58_12135 [Helicobacter saguini]|uniref:Outer membrane protein beta-barrel domain-containing protein n=1 Tax=Helicobacter saguini TaxID=1548018 RepID=A0A099BAS1_9HELI|nr:hypothetical protein [Helicobacter saguini]MWV60962.1 hypothetical protein [Helicobacter saguini]MWV68370.1 hypothetical protein [Helicobacter saguini]MWV70166.1 hypothetical protein [Helicobacter saguini]MWV72069.1 hypothetical protein [Helicobacter saguini]TLD93710.1 hypothetical protein LS64_007915 [Helicobacter saguini]
MKKFGLSIVLASALSMGANAACISNNTCYIGEAGVGGFYSGFGGNNDASANAYGGYFKIAYDGVYRNRFLWGNEVAVGGGMLNVSGAALSGIAQSSGYFNYEILIKLGLNVSSVRAPLFVKVQVGLDNIENKGSLNRDLFYTGLELDGRVPLSSRVGLDYNLRYGWIFAGGYNFGNSANSFLTGYNHRIQASLGFDVKMTENTAFYLRAVGRYYGLQNSTAVNNVSYPVANGYSAGLELGFKGI